MTTLERLFHRPLEFQQGSTLRPARALARAIYPLCQCIDATMKPGNPISPGNSMLRCRFAIGCSCNLSWHQQHPPVFESNYLHFCVSETALTSQTSCRF